MIVRSGILAVLFVGAWMTRATLDRPYVVTTAEALTRFPMTIGSWAGKDAPLDPEVVRVAAVDDHLNRYYESSEGEIGLYVGYYNSQRQGESLHSPLYCLPGAGWQPMQKGWQDLRVAGEGPRTVNKLVVERGIDRLLVLYWYQTVARVTASEYYRKLFLIRDAFVSGRTDVALVRIIAPINQIESTDASKALSVAVPFAERVLPEVQRRLFKN